MQLNQLQIQLHPILPNTFTTKTMANLLLCTFCVIGCRTKRNQTKRNQTERNQMKRNRTKSFTTRTKSFTIKLTINFN